MKRSLLAATLLALALSACGKKDEAAAAPAAPAPTQTAAAAAPAANLTLPVADPAKPAEGIKPAEAPANEQK